MKKNRKTILNRYMADKAIMQEIQQEIAGLKWGKTQFETACEQFREQLIWGQWHALKNINRLRDRLPLKLDTKVEKTLVKCPLWILSAPGLYGSTTPMQELLTWAYYRLPN